MLIVRYIRSWKSPQFSFQDLSGNPGRVSEPLYAYAYFQSFNAEGFVIALMLHCWFILRCTGRYNADTDCLELSYSQFKKSDVSSLGHLILAGFRALRLIHTREGVGENGEYVECSNMTIINLALRIIGPTHEQRLTVYLLTFQASFHRHQELYLFIYFASDHCMHAYKLYLLTYTVLLTVTGVCKQAIKWCIHVYRVIIFVIIC